VSQASLLGGLFIGVLSALPVVGLGNCCCCLWVVCGGVLAAYLDQQRDPTPITISRGAFTGLLAGVIGAVVYFLVASAVSALMAPLAEFTGAMTRSRTDMPAEVRQVFEWVSANPSLALIFDFFMRLFVGSIVAAVGGMLGAAFFRNDVPPALGGPIPPPPLPPM
jgi:Family of unknown function (DUF5518)